MDDIVLRYRLERKATKLPPEYGDPPYRLIWSFSQEDAAEEMMAEELADHGHLYAYRIVDTGPEFL